MSPSDHSYPLDSWKIREIHFDQSMMGRNETIFALANGYLGMRGNFEEGRCNVVNGTYINGFYEESPIVYGETAYGYARNRQVMLNIVDAKPIRLSVNGDRFDLSSGNIIAYERSLDLAAGLLTRRVRWVSPGGSLIEVRARRLVSFVRPHVAAIDYEVVSRNGDAVIEIESALNARVSNQAGSDDPRIGTHLGERVLNAVRREASGTRGLVMQETQSTKMAVACAMDHLLDHPEDADREVDAESFCDEQNDQVVVRWRSDLKKGESIRITKLVAYCTTREFGRSALPAEVATRVEGAKKDGFDLLAREQHEYVRGFWERADIEVEGDEAVQQGLRYNLFSLLQAAGRDGTTGTAAKGLTGEGYEGHYFWDTEIYVLPFFVYSQPQIARALLRYRCGILDKARERARQMNQKGALFPWRTIGGEETSPYYPAGSAQYHINADIVYALKKYLNATFDRELLLSGGAELIFETARLWADLGDWLPSRGDRRPDPPRPLRQGEDAFSLPVGESVEELPDQRFYINEVTGPDEYTAIVNNNAYTNLMAQYNLRAAVETARYLREREPDEFRRIAGKIGLEDSEVDDWRRAYEAIFIPYDRGRGIVAQDDAFLQRAKWDFAGTPEDRYPLLLHFHPLVIYRYQVLKQPDVVLAQVLRGECFSLAEKKRNYDYYDPLTTGDSSLSPCIQSVAACELGYTAQAYRYFMRTARMDLDDINGNVADGVHTAAMAGTWISLVYGFAGMRDHGGLLSFDPRLPADWRRLRMSLTYRGVLLRLDITHENVAYEFHPLDPSSGGEGSGTGRPAAPSGGPLRILHRGAEIELVGGKAVIASLRPTLSCVVFDLDGVITDTAEYHFQAWSRIAEEVGAPIDRTFNEKLKGVSRMESLELILRNGGKELTQQEKLELAERKNGYYRELIAAITPDDLLPGIPELLRQLRSEGIRIAVASVSHNVWEVIKRLEIGDQIDLIVDPEKVVKGKPDPEIFLDAAQTLGLPRENCVGVEDAQAGIDAIKAAGMFAVGIGTTLQGTDWLLPETSELTASELGRRFGSHAGRR